MTILITGAAGFIGFHVARKLLSQGVRVIGIDNLNDYYDVTLKNNRLRELQNYPQFEFHKIDIANRDQIESLIKQAPDIDGIVHLAAQAGVRYSITNPFAYAEANLVGHLTLLEAARHLEKLKHFVYASSSSVYGANNKLPYSIEDRVDQPVSLYAATKRSCELMSYCYSHLYQLPITGLRYFTVYGPWGRPDMSAFIFTKAILEGTDVPVFNYGDMKRNFTYIDDAVQATIACLFSPPPLIDGSRTSRIYNIGNNRSEALLDFIRVLEKHLGKKANIKLEPMQAGDVKETIADISKTTEDFGFIPRTNIDEGLNAYVEWYKSYYSS